jgi:hypothetical protein
MISTPYPMATSDRPPALGAPHAAERRQRMAASADRPLQHTLEQASQALFQSVIRIDELATQALGRPDGQADAAQLCAALDRMNDALQHCDRLATLLDHLQHLHEPAAPVPRSFDLRDLLAQAIYGAHGLLPAGLVIANHLPELPPVRGDRAELMQALIEVVMQIGADARAHGRLVLDGGSGQGMVWIECRVSGTRVPARPGLALGSAIETLARHRGALELSATGDDAFTLRLRLPAAR